MEDLLLIFAGLVVLCGPAALILGIRLLYRLNRIESAAAEMKSHGSAPIGQAAAVPDQESEMPALEVCTPPIPSDALEEEPASDDALPV